MTRLWIEKRLIELRKKKIELAAALGVPPSRISDVIQGKRRVQSHEISALSQFLDLNTNTIIELLSEEKYSPKDTLIDKTEQIKVIGRFQEGNVGYAVWPVNMQYTITLPMQASYTGTPKFALEETSSPHAPLTLHICISSSDLKATHAETTFAREMHDPKTKRLPDTAAIIAGFQQH